MEPLLGGRATVRPPLLINQNTRFPGEDEELDATRAELGQDGDRTLDTAQPAIDADAEADPFVTGAAHRAKKSHRTRDPNEGVKDMINVLKDKWEEDKTAEALARDEEKEGREKILEIMEKNQKAMSDAVDVLKYMANKM